MNIPPSQALPRHENTARFLTETSLEFLARRLRVLGFDVEVVAGANLETLFEAARRDDRTVLTLSARHPPRFADVTVVVVPRADPARAVREIDRSFRPASTPFSRCTQCNSSLEQRSIAEAAGKVPDAIARDREWIAHCARCGRWYWYGSHVDRLCAWLTNALGRAIAPPAEQPP